MAWTAPRTWVAGDVLTAAQMNEQIKANSLILITPLDVLGNLSPDIQTSSVTTNQNNLAITVTTGTLVFTGASAIDITGIVAPATAGKLLSIVNRGSGTHTLKDQVTSTAANRFDLGADVALATDDSIVLVYENSRWRAWCKPPAAASGVDIQAFTSSGTWTKPSSASSTSSVFVRCIGGGGGGGNGSATSAGSGRGGGSGGAAGGITDYMMTAGDLSGTETVTIGAGGAGGAGASSDPGNDGVAGGTTTFGTHARAYGGAQGLGGDVRVNNADAEPGIGLLMGAQSGNWGKASVGQGANFTTNKRDGTYAPGGGGRGGGLEPDNSYSTAGDKTVTAGGAVLASTLAAGAAGVNGSAAGGAGVASNFGGPGAGGGGGGALSTSGSYVGGAGGNYGGGGGGSGGGTGTSAAGGAGGGGYCLVMTTP